VIQQYAAASDGSLLIASICAATNCGAVGPTSADAHARIVSSIDGGHTWTTLAEYDGYASTQVASDGRILIRHFSGEGDPAAWTASWEQLNPPAMITRPAAADPESFPTLVPGGVVWVAYQGNSVIAGDGTPYIKWPLTAADRLAFVHGLDGGDVALGWSRDASTDPSQGGSTKWFIGRFHRDGTNVWTRALNTDAQLSFGDTLSGDVLLANIQDPSPATYGQLPALFDMASGTVQPISGPFGQPPLAGRNRLLAVRRGPFAMVTGAGDCLNVRESATTSARSLGCFKDGVLFKDLGETTSAEGLQWLKVETPSGVPGWASMEFLEQK
jgi:hypothetical protein